MAKSHRNLLARLDPVGLNRYQITDKDVEKVEKYISIIQANLIKQRVETAWQDILRFGGPYGTSILIHEVVEIRELEARDLRPLRRRTNSLRKLLGQHIDAHVMALYEEHRYLQEVIDRLYGQSFEVATLVRANRDDRDYQLFLESDIGVFILEEDRLDQAEQILVELKGKGSDET